MSDFQNARNTFERISDRVSSYNKRLDAGEKSWKEIRSEFRRALGLDTYRGLPGRGLGENIASGPRYKYGSVGASLRGFPGNHVGNSLRGFPAVAAGDALRAGEGQYGAVPVIESGWYRRPNGRGLNTSHKNDNYFDNTGW